MPGMNRHGLPISVARPTASSTALSAAISRTHIGKPFRAIRMSTSTDPHSADSMTSIHARAGSNQSRETAAVAAGSVAGEEVCAHVAQAQNNSMISMQMNCLCRDMAMVVHLSFNQLHISTRNHNSLARFELHFQHASP